jgi:hypothetical protein
MFLLKCCLTFLAHAIVNLGFRFVSVFFAFRQVIVKNAEKVKKKKNQKDQKAKKPRFPLLAPIFDFYAFKTLENIRGQVKSGKFNLPLSP